MNERWKKLIGLAGEIAERYEISSLQPLVGSCRATAERDELSIAIIGRFKAGKSSFLNHFLGRNLLPVGVVPVTTVVTEIVYGPREEASVRFVDGRVKGMTLENISAYIAESKNPGNEKRVSVVTVELPALEPFRGLRFVDMPGLESALAHNTDASLNWLPNVGVALVAVSVDPPLSQQDLVLLKSLYRYTPNVSILLTKVDLLSETELGEVLSFVRGQLMRVFGSAPRILPYSVRSGYEQFKTDLEETLIRKTLDQFQEQHSAILARKVETLLRECEDYLSLALRSAEVIESDRDTLKKQVIGEKEVVEEVKSELRLVVRHAAADTRDHIGKRLEGHRVKLEARLLEGLRDEFPQWTRSLGNLLNSYERWLRRTLEEELQALSGEERAQFIGLLEKVKKQIFRALQRFRDQLSGRTLRSFGFPLRTTEVEITVEEPRSPDVYIGRVFDHNWELLSPVVPVWLVKGAVRRHFTGKLPYMVEKNLSRLASQWTDSINDAMTQIGKEAERRLDELVSTVERLIASSRETAPQIRADLERISSVRDEFGEATFRGAEAEPGNANH
jgi:GTP-binding protein EngB required for normal cell division